MAFRGIKACTHECQLKCLLCKTIVNNIVTNTALTCSLSIVKPKPRSRWCPDPNLGLGGVQTRTSV